MSEGMVDWKLAVTAATKLAGPGPAVSRTEADEVVAELRDDAHRSTPLVREFTGLVSQDTSAPVLVVDRRGWVQANADGFDRLLSPVVEKMLEKRGKVAGEGLVDAIGSRVTGLEVGAL